MEAVGTLGEPCDDCTNGVYVLFEDTIMCSEVVKRRVEHHEEGGSE